MTNQNNPSASSADLEVIDDLYTKKEQEIISRWASACPIAPLSDVVHEANEVANIALFNVRGLLPQWASFNTETGAAVYDRHYELKSVRKRDGLITPILLLEINWGTPGPGFSWTEAYYATRLPGYEFYVVTASRDSAEIHEVVDEAFGYFHAESEEQVAERVKPLILDWWRNNDNPEDPSPWEELFEEGEIDSEEAYRLREILWPSPEDEDEDYDESDCLPKGTQRPIGLPADTDGITFRMLGSHDDPHFRLHMMGWSGSHLPKGKPVTNTEPNK